MLRVVILLVLVASYVCVGDDTDAAGLKIKTTFKPDDCDTADKSKVGNELKMHYKGQIDESSKTGTPGVVFDTSEGRDPFTFVLGRGHVIPGWDKGLSDMCVGEKRTLVVPPELGYGKEGAGDDIPGGATLNFEVELVEIGEAAPEHNVFAELDVDDDRKITRTEIKNWLNNMNAPREGEDGEDLGGPEDTELETHIDNIMENDDKDKDGVISWDEFTGPKGEEHDEL